MLFFNIILLQNSKLNTVLNSYVVMIWAAAWQNQQNDLCVQWRLRSNWADVQSDQSLGLWSDEADAQPDMSLRLAHRSFCWFCHAVTLSHILESIYLLWGRKKKKPTDQPFSRVRGNKDIFKGGPDIAMQHQFSKLKAV